MPAVVKLQGLPRDKISFRAYRRIDSQLRNSHRRTRRHVGIAAGIGVHASARTRRRSARPAAQPLLPWERHANRAFRRRVG